MLMMAGGLGIVRRGMRTEKRQAVRSGVFVDDDDEFVQVFRRHWVLFVRLRSIASAAPKGPIIPSGTGVTVLT